MRYFDELPIELQNVVKNWLADNFSSHDAPEAFECRSRSGFIPHSWNKGGLLVYTKQTLFDYMIGDPSHCIVLEPKVQKAINERIESYLEDARETFLERYAEQVKTHNIKKSEINYHGLEKYDLSEEFGEIESEALSDDYASTYSELRVMFDGVKKFTVDVMFNFSDAPYFRGCDQCVTFTIETLGAKTLAKFLKKITKQVQSYYPG